MASGAILQIRINDPSKFLAPAAAAVAHDVDVLALASNKAYYYARISSSDANGRTHVLTLPFGVPHTLIVRSGQFTLADAKGAPISATGHTEPVQTAVGATTQPYTFTVTGWTN